MGLGFRATLFRMRNYNMKMKRAAWKGYWEWRDGTIFMHCEDGRVMDIRETEDVEFTLENILANDWQDATPGNCPVLAREIALDTARELMANGDN